MAWYFLGYFSRISDGHSKPFYPEVLPPGLSPRLAEVFEFGAAKADV